MFAGKKSYAIAALTVVFGVLGWVLGLLEPKDAVQTILGGLAVAGLRHGIASK